MIFIMAKKIGKKGAFALDIETLVKLILLISFLVLVSLIIFSLIKNNFVIDWLKNL
jgi:hypothetical protein